MATNSEGTSPPAVKPRPARAKPTEIKTPFDRQQKDPKRMADLKASILAAGLKDPIHISEDGDCLSGHCRLEVVRELGWAEIDVLVFPYTTTADKLAHVFACDQRSQVTKADQARRVSLLMREHPDWSQKQYAAGLKVSEATLSRLMPVLHLSPDLMEAVLDGSVLSVSHVTVLMGKVDDPGRREALLREVLTTKETADELLKRISPKRKAAGAKVATVRMDNVTLSYPVQWTLEQLEAALVALRDYLRQAVRKVDVKSLDAAALLGKAVQS